VSGLTRLQSFLEENRALLVGDVLALAVVTAVGFATHGTTGNSRGAPVDDIFTIGRGLVPGGPASGVYNRSMTLEARQLWRPFWAMILAAPLAAWMRGLLLGTRRFCRCSWLCWPFSAPWGCWPGGHCTGG